MCPMQVFDIEDIKGVPTAVASRPRDCTMCRECIRQEEWKENRVILRRQADHFIFTVESVGTLKAMNIVREAFAILKHKAQLFHTKAEEYQNGI